MISESNNKGFLEEISLQSKLSSHANIASVFGVLKGKVIGQRVAIDSNEFQYKLESHDSSYLMVSEYCEDGDLSQWMKKVKENEIEFDEHTALNIMIDVAKGMAFNDKRRVLHRDLKPANILLEDDYRRAKVSDFGLAKIVEQTTEDPARREQTRTYYTVERKGSPVYMAPEVLKSGVCSRAADVYSFGIVLHNVFVSLNEMESFDMEKVKDYATHFGLPIVAALINLVLQEDSFRPVFPPFSQTRMSSAVYEGISALAKSCWDADAKKRPSFAAIVSILTDLKKKSSLQRNQMNRQPPSINHQSSGESFSSQESSVYYTQSIATTPNDYNPLTPSVGSSARAYSTDSRLQINESRYSTSPNRADSLISSALSPLMSPTISSNPTYFELVPNLNTMRSGLCVPDALDMNAAIEFIANQLDMGSEISQLRPLKRRVQHLWAQFVDNDQGSEPWAQFSLVDLIRRIQTELKIQEDITVIEIIREASRLLEIEDECALLSSVKLKVKRISIELGYLPEELLPYITPN